MNSIIFLIILLAIYYYIYQGFYDRFEEKYHYYFYVFVGVYVLILYIYHFEYELFYKVLKNIYDTDKVSLYALDTMHSNQPFQISNSVENSFRGFNIKETLLNKQNGRCYACSNFIMNNDLGSTKLKYKNPLRNGGQNDIENIGLVCSTCYEFQ